MAKNKQNGPPSGKYGGYKGKWQKDREAKKSTDNKPKPKTNNNSDKPATQHTKFDGESKKNSAPANKKNYSNGKPSIPNKKVGGNPKFNRGRSITQNPLFKEILSLGGNKEDFDFLNTDFALSDDEDEAEKEPKLSEKEKSKNSKNEKLSGEVAKFLQNPTQRNDDSDEDEEGNANGEDIEVNGEEDEEKPPVSVVVEEETRESNHDASFNPSEKLFRPLKKALFEPNPLWYELPLDPVEEGPKFSDIVLGQLKTQAKKLIDEDKAIKKKRDAGSQDDSFYDSLMAKGTLVDKISAITLRIQESPFHHMEELEMLVGMVKRKNKREAALAVASFKDLCLNGLIPDDRKLKYFQDQPLSAARVTKTHLALWFFEDLLKRAYFDFLLAAETLSHDQVSHTKLSMATLFFELLKAKPEQEQNLLSLLVNKLGDPDNKVASKASYSLLQLIESHPSMKLVIALEINQLLSRPKISLRTKAYAINTLNQFVLTSGDKDLANYLIELYFSTFNHLLTLSAQPTQKKKRLQKDRKRNKHKKGKQPPALPLPDEEAETSKIIAAILTGVNRAFPFAHLDPETLQTHVDTLFKITHTYNLNTVIQSLNLIYQISNVKNDIKDRYYRVLYQSILDFRLIHTSKQAMYVNLLFKSLKNDDKPHRVVSFVKRLIQTCQWHQPPFICGILYMIHKLTTTHPIINEFFKNTTEQANEARKTKANNGEETGDYDGLKLDPQYAHSETSLSYEITSLVNHFHPTVAVFANQLINNEKIDDNSHLHLHSLMHFLDRFVFRSPKKAKDDGSIQAKGSSIMQPIINPYQKQDMLSMDRAVTWTKGSHVDIQVNSQKFIEQSPDQIAADQQFFYKYFSLVKKAKPMLSTKSNLDSDDEENDFMGSDVEEDDAWDIIKNTNPDGDGEDNFDDEDVDMDGYFDDEDMDMDMDEEVIEEDEVEEDDEEDDEADLKSTSKALSFDDIADDDAEEDDDEDDDEELDDDDDEELEEDTRGTKRKEAPTKSSQKSKKQKNKFKDLPMFASADDYSHMLD
ncbi:CBF-domain-containing protein [Conidiobolus coronatus NRRL 28638]|uniref:CBF-domain-containing protein n=1 Tax=Conidiobolus coronatus (strain ATCC 28846 / CBS 209.66 / NRRL 28638) TaxID=796925 RepID=A0A137PDQ2_CONC2|nr:CBF-domain-containing protein [Conidiobolus coronatus NRRL 28638]|eukprot:KXN73134.1 CBF-domain-containing protein [Conidiobolus coronatus NRRL 28638]